MTQATTKGYDTHDIHIPSILLIVVACLAFLVISLSLTYGYYIHASENAVQSIVYSPESVQLMEYKEHVAEVLSSYRSLDTSTGTYSIPIDRAMDIIAIDR